MFLGEDRLVWEDLSEAERKKALDDIYRVALSRENRNPVIASNFENKAGAYETQNETTSKFRRPTGMAHTIKQLYILSSKKRALFIDPLAEYKESLTE